jgi:hypothetical protein
MLQIKGLIYAFAIYTQLAKVSIFFIFLRCEFSYQAKPGQLQPNNTLKLILQTLGYIFPFKGCMPF